MSRLAPFLAMLDNTLDKIGLADTAVAALQLKVTETVGTAQSASATIDGLKVAVSSVQDELAVAKANADNMRGFVEGIEAGLFRADAQGVNLVGNARILEGMYAKLNSDLQKIDPRGFEQPIQELLAKIQSGKASAQEFISLLETKAPAIGQVVAALVKQFDQGELRADQLQQRLEDLLLQYSLAFKAGDAASTALGAGLNLLGQQAQSGTLLRDLRRGGRI